MNQQNIVAAIVASASFQAEAAYLQRGGIHVRSAARLFKFMEHDRARATFPTDVRVVDDGTVVALVTLFDIRQGINVYAHPICAGPEVNSLLKAVYSPLAQAKPQPGIEGDRAIARFVAWKQAAWMQFLTEELDVGPERASAAWLDRFWRAMDRMYGGDTLQP